MFKIRKYGVAAKLVMGCATVTLLLIGADATTIWQVKKTETATNRIIDLRAPTAQASLAMMNGMKHSLAALRGWMILGTDKFKDAAGQVSSALQQFAGASSEQASSLEETNSTLERMAAMAQTSASNAKAATSTANTANVEAAKPPSGVKPPSATGTAGGTLEPVPVHAARAGSGETSDDDFPAMDRDGLKNF